MMSILFYMIFMIPVIFLNGTMLVQYMYMFMIIYLYLYNFDFFFSSLSYSFGLDSFSYWLIILTFYIFCLMSLSVNSLTSFIGFLNLFLVNYLLSLFLFLVFVSLNYFMMYVFFEFSLVPLFVIIVGWGYQPDRLISSIYLFFYTVFASLPLFLLLLYIYSSFGSLFYDYFFFLYPSFLIHFIMVFAFMVKLPLFMVHFWLPKAHVYSPIFGSMILAGILLKVGGYGIYRFMFIYDLVFINYSYFWFSLAIYGSFLVGIICLIQGDVKCLIAYSSISHMGLCLLGILSMTKTGIWGSYFMMIGHGLCSSGLFFLSNVGYERFYSRSFFLMKGLISFMPSLSFFWFCLCCFNMSCPPSLNFLSEVFILISMMYYWLFSPFYFVLISFFSSFFSFYLFSYSNHGFFHNCYSFSLVNFREYLLCFIHLVPIFFFLFLVDIFF